jgi:hypothetical protein
MLLALELIRSAAVFKVWLRSPAVILLGLFTIGVITACGTGGLAPAEALGQTVDVVEAHIREDAVFVVQTPESLGGGSEYSPGSAGNKWIVVAVCASGKSVDRSDAVELAVAASEGIGEIERREVLDGKFQHYLDCPDFIENNT